MSFFAAPKTEKPKKTFPVAQAYATDERLPIPLTPVESHKIGAIGYDAANQTLAVVFAKGKGDLYHYPNVTPEQHAAFVGAESLGKHFGEHIQGREFKKYPAEVVSA